MIKKIKLIGVPTNNTSPANSLIEFFFETLVVTIKGQLISLLKAWHSFKELLPPLCHGPENSQQDPVSNIAHSISVD